MTIGKKLLISFLTVLIIASFSGILGALMLIKTNNSYKTALVDYGFATGHLGELGMIAQESRVYARDIVFLTDPDDVQNAIAKAHEDQKMLSEALELVSQTTTSDQGKAILADIYTDVENYQNVVEQVIELVNNGQQAEAQTLLYTDGVPLANATTAKIDELLKLNIEVGTQFSNDLDTSTTESIIFTFILIAVATVVSIVIALRITKGISRPIVSLVTVANEISQGNLDVAVDTSNKNKKDEVVQLSHAFNETIAELKKYIHEIARALKEMSEGNFRIHPEIEFQGTFKQIESSMFGILNALISSFGEIKQSSEQVATGADQISVGAQSLSQGATEQAGSIEELSASIETITTQVKQNAEAADEAGRLANATYTEIEHGNEQMQDMIHAMDEINNTSKEIGKIIKTIDDIAFQTNILALNAAVEAARAGAAGSGFAVVADEVRNLASKSSQAAKNTSTLIASSLTAVEKGAKIVNETAESLGTIMQSANETSTLVTQISRASNEQSTSLQEVSLGVEQISTVVQSNSAMSQENAAVSQELSGQAQMLKEIVSKYKLPEDDNQIASVGASDDIIFPDSPSTTSGGFQGNNSKY